MRALLALLSAVIICTVVAARAFSGTTVGVSDVGLMQRFMATISTRVSRANSEAEIAMIAAAKSRSILAITSSFTITLLKAWGNSVAAWNLGGIPLMDISIIIRL